MSFFLCIHALAWIVIFFKFLLFNMGRFLHVGKLWEKVVQMPVYSHFEVARYYFNK
jgi:hypothetical protein